VKALRIDRFGPLEDLRLSEVPDAALPPQSVRVEIEAAAVNPSDLGVALGRFPQAKLPLILGRDFAGRVIEGPSDLIGMPVWGSGGGELGLTRDGTHAEYLILPAGAAIRRPAHLSAEEAAVAGVPFVTAWSALVELGEFTDKQWAIVSGAAGAVGQAALQLAAALGGNAIALVRSSDDLAPLDGLKIASTLRSDRDDVPSAVRDLTAGRGADVALNAVGAPVFQPLFDSLAKEGRMVVFSARGGSNAQLDLFALYRRRLRLFGLDTAVMSLNEISRLYAQFSPFFASGAVKPSAIAARFSLADAREAYQCVDQGLPGKVVLVPQR
jgi:NADPH:quinone reductase